MVLVVAGRLHVLLGFAVDSRVVSIYFLAQRVHADDAIFVFLYFLSLLIHLGLLELVEVVECVSVESPLLGNEEPRVSLLLLFDQPYLQTQVQYEHSSKHIGGLSVEQVVGTGAQVHREEGVADGYHGCEVHVRALF